VKDGVLSLFMFIMGKVRHKVDEGEKRFYFRTAGADGEAWEIMTWTTRSLLSDRKIQSGGREGKGYGEFESHW
jgi:hypothetical protein